MLICIAPDKEGKFGFNVKVGPALRFTTRTDYAQDPGPSHF